MTVTLCVSWKIAILDCCFKGYIILVLGMVLVPSRIKSLYERVLTKFYSATWHHHGLIDDESVLVLANGGYCQTRQIDVITKIHNATLFLLMHMSQWRKHITNSPKYGALFCETDLFLTKYDLLIHIIRWWRAIAFGRHSQTSEILICLLYNDQTDAMVIARGTEVFMRFISNSAIWFDSPRVSVYWVARALIL